MYKIYFSSVWEDYAALRGGLCPSENDVVFSIASAGDNIFNFIIDKVKKVIAVDVNPAQLSLSKLKLKIIHQCTPQKTVEILSGMGDKVENKTLLNEILSSSENGRLLKHLSRYDLGRGVDNIGEFETKLLPIISFFIKKHFVLDTSQTRRNLKKPSVWLRVLPVLLSFKIGYRFLLPDFPYQYVNLDIRRSLNECLINFLTFNNHSRNWYLQKIRYGYHKLLPPFIHPDNFYYLRNNLNKIDFVEGDALSHLKRLPNNSVNKINLSDIFDWCSPEEYLQTLREAHRVLSVDGKIFYWEFLVSRKLPETLSDKFLSLDTEADILHKRDNIPFYHKIVLLRKK